MATISPTPLPVLTRYQVNLTIDPLLLRRHHQTYVTNLIKALEKAPELKEMDLNELQRAVGTGQVPKDVQGAVRNHGGVRQP